MIARRRARWSSRRSARRARGHGPGVRRRRLHRRGPQRRSVRPTSPTATAKRWAPVLIAWSDPIEIPELAGDVAGRGRQRVVSEASDGGVRDGADRARRSGPRRDPTGPRASPRVRGVIEHELGHLVGLDHVNDPTQLMNPVERRLGDDLRRRRSHRPEPARPGRLLPEGLERCPRRRLGSRPVPGEAMAGGGGRVTGLRDLRLLLAWVVRVVEAQLGARAGRPHLRLRGRRGLGVRRVRHREARLGAVAEPGLRDRSGEVFRGGAVDSTSPLQPDLLEPENVPWWIGTVGVVLGVSAAAGGLVAWAVHR